MTTWEWIGTALPPAVISGGGVWSYLKVREASRGKLRRAQAEQASHLDDNKLEREGQAIAALNTSIKGMEDQIQKLSHDVHVYRRVSHDMADIANAVRLVLISKFTEVNEVLAEFGKPKRYADPVRCAMEEVDRIAESFVGERQKVYDRAELLEEKATLEKSVIDAQKNAMVENIQSHPPA